MLLNEHLKKRNEKITAKSQRKFAVSASSNIMEVLTEKFKCVMTGNQIFIEYSSQKTVEPIVATGKF